MNSLQSRAARVPLFAATLLLALAGATRSAQSAEPDVAGVRLGDSQAQVTAALQVDGWGKLRVSTWDDLSINTYSFKKVFPGRSYPFAIETEASDAASSQRPRTLRVQFASPPGRGVVYVEIAQRFLEGNRPSKAVLKSSLEKKYGPPSRERLHPEGLSEWWWTLSAPDKAMTVPGKSVRCTYLSFTARTLTESKAQSDEWLRWFDSLNCVRHVYASVNFRSDDSAVALNVILTDPRLDRDSWVKMRESIDAFLQDKGRKK